MVGNMTNGETGIRTKTRYGIIGVSGYVAKKHIEAIYANGGVVTGCCDLHDNVGFLDKYSLDIKFTNSYYELLKWDNVDTVVICTPNHLHYSMAFNALQSGKDVILEKPACLNIEQLNSLIKKEKETGKQVSLVMQLRYNNELLDFIPVPQSVVYVKYHAPRGDWYRSSWKHNQEKSGGIAFNIGIHVLDILTYSLGPVVRADVKYANEYGCSGVLICGSKEEYTVYYDMSTDPLLSPCRSITAYCADIDISNLVNSNYSDRLIKHCELDLSHNFENSHIKVYKEINNGNRITLKDAENAIQAAKMIVMGTMDSKLQITNATKVPCPHG